MTNTDNNVKWYNTGQGCSLSLKRLGLETSLTLFRIQCLGLVLVLRQNISQDVNTVTFKSSLQTVGCL